MKKLLSAILTIATAIAMAMSMTVTASAAKSSKPSAAKLSVRYASCYEDKYYVPDYAIMSFKQKKGTTTYFTIDGSEPSKENGFKYEGGTFGIDAGFFKYPFKYVTYTNGKASSVKKFEFRQTMDKVTPGDIFYDNSVWRTWTSAEKKAVRKAYENLKPRLYEYFDKYMQVMVERYGCPAVEWQEDFTDEEDDLWTNFYSCARKNILLSFLSAKEYTGYEYTTALDGCYYPVAAYSDEMTGYDPAKLIAFYNAISEKFFMPYAEEDIPDRIYNDLVKYSYTDNVWEDSISPWFELYCMNVPTFMYEGEILTPELDAFSERGRKFRADERPSIPLTAENYLDVNTFIIKYTNTHDRSKTITFYAKYAYQCAGFYRPYDQLTDEEKKLVGDYFIP